MSIPPSEYDEELVVASNSTFIKNLQKIDNVILNELANQNLAPRQLIKKRAEKERTTIGTSETDSNEHFFKNSASGQLQTKIPIQFYSNRHKNQSVLTRNNSLENSTNFVKVIQKETKISQC